MRRRYGLLPLAVPSVLAACSSDRPTQPAVTRTFQVTVHNVSMVYDFPTWGRWCA